VTGDAAPLARRVAYKLAIETSVPLGDKKAVLDAAVVEAGGLTGPG